MEVLGEDQRMALVDLLRSGAPKMPVYESANLGEAYTQGQGLGKGLAKLSAAGDGSVMEGVKNKLGMGNPNLYADNYQEEFGKYDPSFKANPTMPVGMLGNSLYRGNGR